MSAPAAPGAAVVTLTAAGAIDATYRVGALERGAFIRADAYERELSGKGVNVAAGLALAGRRTAAVVVMGEEDLDFAARSPHAGLLRLVTVPGATRVNTSVTDGSGATTKINAPVPPIPGPAWEDAASAVHETCAELRAGWLVVSGTLPRLLGEDEPVDLSDVLATARRRGVRLALDTSGPALARAAADPAGIALVKPNTHELAELVGRSLRTIGDVARAAGDLVHRGIEVVFVSMGADGVLVVTEGEVVHAHAHARAVVNTAGAGDASLAGFLVGLGDSEPGSPGAPARAAARAAAWGAHAVSQATTILPDLDGLPDVSVDLDPVPERRLTEPAA
ncbi:1-phosphofructokinase family hexose kinase [Agromyces kandeliae]|uniref:Hexose kinase n=1 Tax=Agromyces kandeliae TaxID=2666141 RepID=A0A6L5R2A7_9MICO|nr:hexose kinase [Agromyces kandeliae]MRX44025.1 hexose kinase [Agromyces kandeliae]